MIPQQGDYVKCFLRNTTQIEGSVIDWLDKQVVLKTLDESILIIHKPNDDIMLTMILSKPPTIKANSEQKQIIREKLQETQQIEDPQLRDKSVRELRELAVEQEKQMIASKIKEHHLDSSGGATNYASQIALIRKSK